VKSRELARAGTSAALVVAMMLAAGVVMWVGIPLGWLWIASKVEAATDSLGAAIGAMMFGVIASIALMIPVLAWLSDRHRALQVARGRDDTGTLVLEIVMVTSAGIALVTFLGWFFLFSGASPFPFGGEGT
jgi:hypothetical protein